MLITVCKFTMKMEKLGETSIQLKVWEEDFAFHLHPKNDCSSAESFADSFRDRSSGLSNV